MTASNHVVAGALIATAVANPLAAVPLAFASHFVLDMLPHYGENGTKSWLGRNFNHVLFTDAAITSAVLLGLILLQPANILLILVCGIIAVLPDLVWLPYYMADLRQQPLEQGPFARFSKWIQWGETPKGIYIEILFFALLLTVLLRTI